MADIPDIKKCCFCVPPRPGLITWGYLNIILSLVIIGLSAYIVIVDLFIWDYTGNRVELIIMFAVSSVVPLIDVVFNVMLVVAGHEVNYKLFNIYYKYGTIRIAIYIIVLLAVNLGYSRAIRLVTFVDAINPSWSIRFNESPAIGVVDILLQCYIVLVLRSYMRTLDNKEQLQPLNSATETDCHLEMDHSNLYSKIEIKNLKINTRTS